MRSRSVLSWLKEAAGEKERERGREREGEKEREREKERGERERERLTLAQRSRSHRFCGHHRKNLSMRASQLFLNSLHGQCTEIGLVLGLGLELGLGCVEFENLIG
jgi:hypothetical protein